VTATSKEILDMATEILVRDTGARLDVTGDACPITWVKTKLALEDLDSGSVLILRLNTGEALRNVPMSAKEEGHRVLTVVDNSDGSYTLAIKRDGLS
jgi:TusA-related sulfurtransferase